MLRGVATLAVAALSASLASAQVADTTSHIEPYSWHSGAHDGVYGHTTVVRHVVRSRGATWLRLRFTSARLGSSSDVTISSLADSGSQRLDSVALGQWDNQSAYLNGDAVEVRLSVRYPDRGIGIGIDQLEAGEAPMSTTSICGTDDRVSSNDAAVGRLTNGCTAWIISNGKLVTAGHCAGNISVVEFNVPLSSSSGQMQHPAPQHQYTVNQGSIVFSNGGTGNDYGVFTVFNNSQTGLSPIQAQGRSFNVVQSNPGGTIRVTGYGTDTGSANQTNQTHSGPLVSVTSSRLTYAVDTMGGNSGSPIIDAGSGNAVGVHTHGGCSASGGANSGTRATLAAFWSAMGLSGGTATPTARVTARPTARASATPTSRVRATSTARATARPTVRPSARPTSGGGTWAPNTSYSIGAVVTYGGASYRCQQAHTSQVGWEPPNTPALWTPQ
jgi:V8-like Glu-specific endopeptidase